MVHSIHSLSQLFQSISLYSTLDVLKLIETNPEIIEIANIRKYSSERHNRLAMASMFGSGSRISIQDAVKSDLLEGIINYFRNPTKPQDAFCPQCGEDSVFDFDKNYILGNSYQIKNDKLSNNQFCTSFVCTRCKQQRLLFLFELDGVILKKIAQFPSQMDLLLPEVKKYQRELGEYSSEFYKAIGLHASGIGVGAFVYLRRIFEKLIFNTYEISGSELLPEDEFLRLDMSEKIDLLSEFLPDELIENKSIYGILSIGIHELSENDCLKYFDSIRLGIEAILDDIIDKRKRLERKKKIASGVQEIHREIAK